MSQKSEQLIGLLDYARDETEKFYAALPESERLANGTWETWAPKDFLAHFTFWQYQSVAVLNALDAAPPEEPPFEERNRANWLNNETRAYADIYADYTRAMNELRAGVETKSDTELSEPQHFPRLPNGSLQGNILGNAYSHTLAHIAELYSKRNSGTAGYALQEEATQKVIAFDPSPRAKGTALYNLACAYALAGNAGRTVELLREAFPLRPDLVEFSKEDGDFNLVRDVPEFQALYN